MRWLRLGPSRAVDPAVRRNGVFVAVPLALLAFMPVAAAGLLTGIVPFAALGDPLWSVGLLAGMLGGTVAAAATAGRQLAPEAADTANWPGIQMGALTFVLALPCGLLILGPVLLAENLPSSLTMLPAAPLAVAEFSCFGYLLFAPLLPVSCLAGIVWSLVTARLNGSRSVQLPHLAMQLVTLIPMTVLTVAFWAAVIGPFTLGSPGSFD